MVLILKKTQGSVWSEHGRTRLCPTPEWLRDHYGAGQFELRLKVAGRTLCMASVVAPALAEPPTRWAASDSGRVRAGTVPRGTALA
jgi:hypothetical protein